MANATEATGDAARLEVESLGGETLKAEESYKTPSLSSPDTVYTPTIPCESDREPILYGDFQMDPRLRGCPDLTLGIIKPDAMKYADEIQRMMQDEGFTVVQRRLVHLSPEQASNFYHEHYGQPYFPALVVAMSEAPIKVFLLRGENAIVRWKNLCGPYSVIEAKKKWPESLRAIYGTPGEDHKNACHASDSPEKALEEIRFFFPHMILDPNVQEEINAEDYLRDYVNPTLLEGLAQVCKCKPIDPVLWLAEWLLMNNPNKPKMERIITLTPT